MISDIQNLLHQHNSYVKDFKSALRNVPSNQFAKGFKIKITAECNPVGQHKGCFNVPLTNEESVLLDGNHFGNRDIILHSRGGHLKRINELHRSYDPLQYPLMFPFGDDGYSIDIPQAINSKKMVSCMSFYSYRLMIRDDSFNQIHLHHYRNLLN